MTSTDEPDSYKRPFRVKPTPSEVVGWFGEVMSPRKQDRRDTGVSRQPTTEDVSLKTPLPPDEKGVHVKSVEGPGSIEDKQFAIFTVYQLYIESQEESLIELIESRSKGKYPISSPGSSVNVRRF